MNQNEKKENQTNSILNKKIEMENNHKSQNRRVKEQIGDMEEFEDVTKYGEFVSSYFAWLNLEKQKEIAKKMENMTDKK